MKTGITWKVEYEKLQLLDFKLSDKLEGRYRKTTIKLFRIGNYLNFDIKILTWPLGSASNAVFEQDLYNDL